MTVAPRPQAASARPIVNKRWLWAVRGLALLTLLISLPWVVSFSVYFFPFALIPAAGYVWVVHSLSKKLDAKTPQEGLAAAVWVGAATLLFLVPLELFITEHMEESGSTYRDWPDGFLVLGFQAVLALVPIALMASAIRTLRTTVPKPQGSLLRGMALLHGLLYLPAPLLGLVIIMDSTVRSTAAVNQASAVLSLRDINSAMTTYQSTYRNGFAPDLKVLGPPSPAGPSGRTSAAASCQAAGLIDKVLASGRMRGYIFELTPGPRTENTSPGCPVAVQTYAVTARPMTPQSGGTNYFTDQTGVIRSTSENRRATAADPPSPASNNTNLR